MEAIRNVISGENRGKNLITIEEKLRNNAYAIAPDEIDILDNVAKGASGTVRKGILALIDF